jgi:hypothetical protein
VAPFVGFALAGRVFMLGDNGDWELWKAAVLGALMMAPFAVGTYFGLRSVLKGFRGGWGGLASNLVLAALAIAMPNQVALADFFSRTTLRRLLGGAIVTAVGIGVFAWAANPPGG